MNWYGLALVLLLAAAIIPDGTQGGKEETLKGLKSMTKNLCKRKAGVSESVLDSARKGDFGEDPKLKCYLKCVLGMMNSMKNNRIDVKSSEKQTKLLLPESMQKRTLATLRACKDTKGSDGCDLAYRFTVCCYRNDPENFFIPL